MQMNKPIRPREGLTMFWLGAIVCLFLCGSLLAQQPDQAFDPFAELNETAHGQDSLALATRLAEKEDWVGATDAYLAAYEANPDLYKWSHLAAFRKANRMVELAQDFDEEKLRKMSWNNTFLPLAETLIRDPKTNPHGIELLKRVFKVQDNGRFLALRNPSFRWKDIPDPIYYLRTVFVPEDFKSEGAGWERISVGATSDDDGSVSGLLTDVKPLCHNPIALRQFADEVRVRLEENRTWDAGWALLAFIEAEIGNYREAADLLSANPDHIPESAAWMLGVSLEGKDQELDRVLIKLLEPCLRKFKGTSNRSGNYPLRVSPIKTLAGLYARQDRRREARQLLYGLVDEVDQHPLIKGHLLQGSDGGCYHTGKGRCAECHSTVLNKRDFMVMTDGMTEAGYPVDSLLSLARMDASYRNVFGSARGWIDTSSNSGIALDKIINRATDFKLRKAEAEKAVTPRLVIEALELDTFRRWPLVDEDKKGNENVVLNLMLSVRGEGEAAEPTVFSPVVDILKVAVNAQGAQSNKDIAELDAKILASLKQHPENTEVAIAATVFAFLRYDFDAAGDRMKKLQKLRSAGAKEPQRSDLGLWLVARYALADDRTKALGEQFAKWAVAAAEKQPDPRWKQAMLREQKEIVRRAALRK